MMLLRHKTDGVPPQTKVLQRLLRALEQKPKWSLSPAGFSGSPIPCLAASSSPHSPWLTCSRHNGLLAAGVLCWLLPQPGTLARSPHGEFFLLLSWLECLSCCAVSLNHLLYTALLQASQSPLPFSAHLREGS